MNVQRIFDPEFIRSVAANLWDEIADGNLAFDDWQPFVNDCWLSVEGEDGLVGLYNFHVVTSATLECHPMVIREQRRHAKAAGAAAIAWMRENSGYQKLVCWAPENLKHVKRYALSLGFQVEGFCTNSYVYRGQLVGRWLLGFQLR